MERIMAEKLTADQIEKFLNEGAASYVEKNPKGVEGLGPDAVALANWFMESQLEKLRDSLPANTIENLELKKQPSNGLIITGNMTMEDFQENAKKISAVIAQLPAEEQQKALEAFAKLIKIDKPQVKSTDDLPEKPAETPAPSTPEAKSPVEKQAPSEESVTINGIKFTRIGDGDVIKMERSETDEQTGITTTKSAYVGAGKEQAAKMWSDLKALDAQENNTDISRNAIRDKLDKIMPNDATTDPLIYNGMPKSSGEAIDRWQKYKPNFGQKEPDNNLLPQIRDPKFPAGMLDGFELPDSMKPKLKPEPQYMLLRDPPITVMSDGTRQEQTNRMDKFDLKTMVEDVKKVSAADLEKYTVDKFAFETDAKSVPVDLVALAQTKGGR